MKLFAIVRKLRKDKNCNWHVNKFYVVKKAKGFHKGDKVFDLQLVAKLQSEGAKFREILTYDKYTRTALRRLAKALDVRLETQHGFTKKRGIITAVNDVDGEPSLFDEDSAVVFVDLENAFNQISEHQLYLLLKRTFFLNEDDSLWLSKVMTFRGYVFQGNPVSPLIFNILSRFITMNVNKMSKKSIKVVQYADDIAFVCKGKEYASPSMVNFIIKMVEYAGWKVNRSKIEVRKAKSDWVWLGIRKHNGTFNPNGLRKLKKTVKWLFRAWQYGARHSKERMSKVTGLGNSIAQVINGKASHYNNVIIHCYRGDLSNTFFYNLLYQIKTEFANDFDAYGTKNYFDF